MRLSYAYYLVIDGIAVWGQDNDPGHDPAIHRHGRRHEERHPDVERELDEILEHAWKTAEDEALWANNEDDFPW